MNTRHTKVREDIQKKKEHQYIFRFKLMRHYHMLRLIIYTT